MKKSVSIPLFLFLLLSLGGCRRVDLHHNLLELEADEIMVALHQNGIEARKEKEVTGQEVSWKISVTEGDVARARHILISNNLPRRRELGLSGVYKDKGLIPTPDEQKARFLLALKGEIINSLLRIPGVVEADVVLNVPDEGDFADLDPVKKRPTASVVVRTRNDDLVAQTVTEGKIQRFVANTVPNLDANDVSVIVSRTDTGAGSGVGRSPATAAPAVVTDEGGMPVIRSAADGLVDLAGIRLSGDSVGRFKGYMIGLLSLLVAVSLFLLYNVVRLNRMKFRLQRGARQERGAALTGGEGRGLLNEGRAGGVEGTFDVGTTQRQV